MNPLADRVRDERLNRGWSIRDAATLGEISNTWWGKFEDGIQPVTEGIITAVSKAYGWSDDWASQPDVTAVRIEVLWEAMTLLLARAGLDPGAVLALPPSQTGAEQ